MDDFRASGGRAADKETVAWAARSDTGQTTIPDGRHQMADPRWQMPDGHRTDDNTRWQTPDGRPQMADARRTPDSHAAPPPLPSSNRHGHPSRQATDTAIPPVKQQSRPSLPSSNSHRHPSLPPGQHIPSSLCAITRHGDAAQAPAQSKHAGPEMTPWRWNVHVALLPRPACC
ncbi:hypothetical protein PMIN02_011118 [Paraphaeosphaeria minitans]